MKILEIPQFNRDFYFINKITSVNTISGFFEMIANTPEGGNTNN